MTFPNLPYLVDQNFKLSETVAIMTYLAKKYDEKLLGNILSLFFFNFSSIYNFQAKLCKIKQQYSKSYV